jgi:hypothetical protein
MRRFIVGFGMRLMVGLGLSTALAAVGASGCMVREHRYAQRPGPATGCRGGDWVEGHYGRHGRWHPGHYRCPGVVERVDID